MTGGDHDRNDLRETAQAREEASDDVIRELRNALNARDELIAELQRAAEAQRGELERMQKALDTRDLIGMAKGLIMSSRSCTPDNALEILKGQARNGNRKLRDVAREIVTHASHRAYGRPR